MTKWKMTKELTSIHKTYTYNKISSKTNVTSYRRWSQVFRKGKQFLLHYCVRLYPIKGIPKKRIVRSKLYIYASLYIWNFRKYSFYCVSRKYLTGIQHHLLLLVSRKYLTGIQHTTCCCLSVGHTWQVFNTPLAVVCQ
jgi:hypothetical protein